MTIRITIEDEITPKLDKLGADAGKIVNLILSRTGAKYRDYIKRNYLSGQMLGRRSGKLWKSVRSTLLRDRQHTVMISAHPKYANIYEKGGVIDLKTARRLREYEEGKRRRSSSRGKSAKALRFIGPSGQFVFTKKPIVIRRRPFMTSSESSFPFSSTFEAIADRTFDEEFKKRGLV